MRVVFITHNRLGLACLEELACLGADIRGVFTRKEEDAVADQVGFEAFAEEYEIPLHRVISVNAEETCEQIESYDPELLFVAGWSELVRERVIDASTVATLGMHPTPLPRGRGRAPIAWSLIKGYEETALSMFHLVEEADAGDLVGQRRISIEIEDDAASLYEKVVETGRDLIRETYPIFEDDTVPRLQQDQDAATWWPVRKPRHGIVDWTKSSKEVYNWIRGQSRPYPGAFSYLDDTRVTFWEADVPTSERVYAEPGEIMGTTANGVRIATWESTVTMTKVQVEDGDTIDGAELVESYDFEQGDRFIRLRDLVKKSSEG